MSDHQPARTADSSADDRELLLTFVRSGSEAAFTEIVRRHAGPVRAVAWRTTGDSGLAEETVQSVFTLLARKAAAAARSGHVAGWLHRAAVFEAMHRVRAEARRRRKLAAFAEDMSTFPPAHDSPPSSPARQDALQVLDSCIQSLRESDRQVLLMRWFESRGGAEIAAALGKSEEAAKRQGSRALERLRRSMMRRGVSLPGASLTAVLSVAQTPAPAFAAMTATASSLARTALSAAPGLPWKILMAHSLHFMNGLKTTTTAAAALLLLLCAAPVFRQERAIALARREITDLESRAVMLPSTMEATAAAAPVPARVPVIVDIEQVARDAEASRSTGFATASRRASMDRIAALDAETVSRLMEDVPKLSGGRNRQAFLLRFLFEDLRAKDRRRAVARIALMVRSTAQDDMPELHSGIMSLLSERVGEDPDAALGEYRALVDSGGLESRGVDAFSDQISGFFTGALYAARPQEAKVLYRGLSKTARIHALEGMASAAADAMERGLILAETEKLEPHLRPSVYAGLLTGEMERGGLDGAAALLPALGLPPGQAREAAVDFVSNANGLSAARGLEWLRARLPAEQFARAGGKFMIRAIDPGPGNIEENRIRKVRAYDWGAGRDEAIAAFLGDERRGLPTKADLKIGLAAEITNPGLRLETLRRMERKFSGNPSSFRAAVEASAALTPEEKTQTLSRQP